MKRAAPAAIALLLLCLAAAVPAAAQAPRAGASRGLWIGPIPACAGTVASVAVGPDEVAEDWLSAIITFRPAWRAALLRETRRRLNRPMPVRLDGRVLMAPIVREPIAGGMISLAPVTARQGERIRAAARRPCARGRR
ncbi:MAG TPA: hypothetical protein VMS43_17440 [Allosphingosinicella sp.]|nr:hypothetical protein [Allosphingosinicella sp.]